MKPSFLFLNFGGDFLGIQMRIQEEGFECHGFYDSTTLKGKGKAGKGLVELVDDPFDIINKYVDHPDDLIILIDDNSKGSMCDSLRSMGFPVIGSSEISDKYEHEREKGNELASKIGISLPDTETFNDFPKALEFLAKEDKNEKFFFKGDGVDLAGSSKTYGAKNVDDMVRYLNWVQKDQGEHNYIVEKFELQRIVDGIEVDISSWFNGKEFSDIGALCFEQKKLEGLGAAQGCYGQVITYIPLEDPYGTYFSKLRPEVSKGGANEWAINAIVSSTDRQPYFLEWTPRFGWDSTFGELALLQEKGIRISEFFIRIAYKRPFPKNFFPIGRFSAAARIFSESPGTPGKDVCGKPLWIDPSIEKDCWFYSVKKDEDQLVLTDTCFMVVTACGDTPEEAVAKLYNILDPKNDYITTPDIFYSKNIGKGVSDSIRALSEYNIIGQY